jgi:hypothetical protein
MKSDVLIAVVPMFVTTSKTVRGIGSLVMAVYTARTRAEWSCVRYPTLFLSETLYFTPSTREMAAERRTTRLVLVVETSAITAFAVFRKAQ